MSNMLENHMSNTGLGFSSNEVAKTELKLMKQKTNLIRILSMNNEHGAHKSKLKEQMDSEDNVKQTT